MFLLPKQEKTWTQPNNSDVLGDLWVSFGANIVECVGKLRAAVRMVRNTSTRDVADMVGAPTRFFKVGTHIYTIAGDNNDGFAFYNDGKPDDVFVKDVSAGAPTLLDSKSTPMTVSNNVLQIAAPRPGSESFLQVYTKLGNLAWDTFDIDPSISSGWPNPYAMAMESFAGRTYLSVEASRIISWDSDYVVSISGPNTLLLDVAANGTKNISFIKAASDRLWIGTINEYGGTGFVYEWDGISATFNKAYPLQSSGALACVIFNDVPHVIDCNGDLVVWNGGAFIKKSGLNRLKNKQLKNPTSSVHNRFVYPYGGDIVEDRVAFLINGVNNDGSLEETIPSGIYEYDETNGLIHKNPITLTKSDEPIIDHGQIKLSAVGGLSRVLIPSTDPTDNGTFMCGATFYTNATDEESGVFYDDRNNTIQKALSIVSSKLEASDGRGVQSIQNMFQSVFVLFKKLLNVNDQIVLKIRTEDKEPTIATITWTSTTTFTTTTPISAYWSGGLGGEVEIIQGLGSGKCAHISNLVNVAGTFTVTVDQEFPYATGTSIARFQNWKHIAKADYGENTFIQGSIGKLSNWVQLKVFALFTGKDEIEGIAVTNDNTRPVK